MTTTLEVNRTSSPNMASATAIIKPSLHPHHNHHRQTIQIGSRDQNSHRITLHRTEGVGLGFTVRGGVEHGLGHFVSEVEQGSEAHLQGLRAGDQILRVCGLPLWGATHKEVVTLISSKWKVDLEVRSVGMIPVKAHKGDPITWLPVATDHKDTATENITNIKPQNFIENRVVIKVIQGGLGCSICKGPPDKPGIFVQSTKPEGIARNSGLRPGDQILDCNGVSFQNIDFTEAVYQLKSSKQLDLLIRKGAGADLFPNEQSSGYNSSASSNKSDASDNTENVSRILVRAQIETPPPFVSNGNLSNSRRGQSPNPSAINSVTVNNMVRAMSHSDLTFLEIEEKERLLDEERRFLEYNIKEERQKLIEEHEKLKREAQRLEVEKKKFEEEKKMTLVKTSSTASSDSDNSFESTTSSMTSGGLAGALQIELKKRAQRQKGFGSTGNLIERKMNKNNNLRSKKVALIANLQNDKHDKLIEEFRRAHKKMFNSSTDEEGGEDNDDEEEDQTETENDTETETDSCNPMGTLTLNNVREVEEMIDRSESVATNATSSSSSCDELKEIAAKSSKSKNPPPPPERTSSISPLTKSKPHTSKNPTPSPSVIIPTPDYDTTPERSPKPQKKILKSPSSSNVNKTSSNVNNAPSSTPKLISSNIIDSNSSSSMPQPPSFTTSSTSSSQSSTPSPRPAFKTTLNLNNIRSSKTGNKALPPPVLKKPLHPPPTIPEDASSTASMASGGSSSTRLSRTTLVKKSKSPSPMTNQPAFAKRHPEIEVGSLDSFSLGDSVLTEAPKPPPYYFEPVRPKPLVSISAYMDKPDPVRFEFLPQPTNANAAKTVRFSLGEEADIASKDYRAMNASGKSPTSSNGHFQNELEKTLSRSGLKKKAGNCSSSSNSNSSSSVSSMSPPTSSDEERSSPRTGGVKPSPKKHPPPPPPPPPPPMSLLTDTLTSSKSSKSSKHSLLSSDGGKS